MPRYKIIPLDDAHSAISVDSRSPTTALAMLERFGFDGADVFREMTYCFSAWAVTGGAWYIFKRGDVARAPQISSRR